MLQDRTNAEVLGGRLEEGVLLGLGSLASTEGGSSGLLSGSGLLGGLVIETRVSKETNKSFIATASEL